LHIVITILLGVGILSHNIGKRGRDKHRRNGENAG